MRFFFTIALFTIATTSILAQKNDTDIIKKYVNTGNSKARTNTRKIMSTDAEFLKQLSVSFSLGTNGFGVEAVTPLSDKVNVRAGLDYWPAIMKVKNEKLNVNDGNLIRKIGYTPKYDVDFSPKLFHGHALIDFYPSKESSFHFTAGFYVGSGNIQADGNLRNPQTGEKSVLLPEFQEEGWPNLNVEQYNLNIDDGTLNVDIRMGKTIKPYLGIGFGNAITKDQRLGFNLDMGIIYQGDYTIRQFGKEADKNNDYTSSAINIDKYAKYVKVWPVLNFQLTYRIF